MIQLWNIHEKVPIYVGPQSMVNILGNLENPGEVVDLTYRLNDGPVVPVFIKTPTSNAGRLLRDGDFNIDTISCEKLLGQNELVLTMRRKSGEEINQTYSFLVTFSSSPTHKFCLNLRGVNYPQEVGQIVDGRWQIGRGENGEPCVEIRRDDAGLDRIILFGHGQLEAGYTVRTRLCVKEWCGVPHNVGLLFNWNPHLKGDGTTLPSQWSTGLGYYYSNCRGIRLRIGVNVHVKEGGEKVGDLVLGEKPLSFWRYGMNNLDRMLFGEKGRFPQLVAGRDYVFELQVRDDEYVLRVWPCDRPQTCSKIVVQRPPKLLPSGATGIIAHRCAVQVYEFEVSPTS